MIIDAFIKNIYDWSGGPDLNRRPLPWEGSILPLNYHRIRKKCLIFSPLILAEIINASNSGESNYIDMLDSIRLHQITFYPEKQNILRTRNN